MKLNDMRNWPLLVLVVIPFTMLIFFAGGASGYFSYYNGQQSVQDLIQRLLVETSDHIHTRLTSFFSTPATIVNLNAEMWHVQFGDRYNIAHIERQFFNQIREFHVRGVFVGDEQARGVAVFQDDDGSFQSRVIETPPVRRFYALDVQGKRLEQLRHTAWDPRTRPWYTGAVKQPDTPVWSPVYTFTDGVLGISVSRTYRDSSRTMLGVIGVDLDLGIINHFLHTIKVSPSGQTFILEPDGAVIATSMERRHVVSQTSDQGTIQRITWQNTDNPVIRETVMEVRRKLGDLSKIMHSQSLGLVMEGEKVEIRITPIRDDYGLNLIAVVAIPEKDFMMRIATNTKRSIQITVGMLFFSLMIGFLVSRKITQPIAKLASAAEKMAQGDFKQNIGVSWSKELKILSVAFAVMAQRVSNTIMALESLNTELESRVVERTQDLEMAKVKAEEATASKSQFLANMSHEIRTPMNAVIGLSDLALQTDISPRTHDYLTKINSSSRSLLRIINDILDFSKIEAGKLSLEPVEFILGDVFDDLANLFRAKTSEHNIELIMVISGEYYFELRGDSLRLEQILINLLGNALKFSEEGEVEVHARAITPLSELQAGRPIVLEFSIRDTGIGMSQDQVDTLFQPFVQADGSTTRKFGGTGLGLSICKRLVHMMGGGQIEVESTVGQGSVFRFTVTFEWVSESGDVAKPKTPQELQRLKTLVVDDNLGSRHALAEMLRLFTFEAVTVASGKEAVETIEREMATEHPFQLVLVDWFMPGMNGIQTMEKIVTACSAMERDGLTQPRMILLTDFNREQEIMAQSEALPIDAYLTKPVNCATVFDAIMAVFGHALVKVYRPGRDTLDPNLIADKIGGARVLLAEDNAINRQVAIEILEKVGLVVAVAEHGKEAVKMVLESAYDVVLMDIQMPEMDGHEAAQHIRTYDGFKDLPIIAMTAHAMATDREKSLASGMNDHVSKPIDQKQLFTALIKWIAPKERVRPVVMPDKPVVRDATGLPDNLPGIDTVAALTRLNDNHALFRSLLMEFHRDFASSAEEIHHLLEGKRGDDLASAGRMAHSVKGMAGNLAAQELLDAAQLLETGIQEEQRQAWPALLAGFERALAQVVASIGTLKREEETFVAAKTSEASEQQPVDREKLMPLLHTLSGLLLASDSDAQDSFEALKPQLAGAGDEVLALLKQLEEHLDVFGFKEAHLSLQELAGFFDVSLEENIS